jgi:RNA polymerase sigma-70 factor, ECF subfamily
MAVQLTRTGPNGCPAACRSAGRVHTLLRTVTIRVNPSSRIRKGERWLRLAPRATSSPPSGGPLDDAALIEAVVRRDIRAAGELYDRLIAVIHSTLYRLLGRKERDHDDLVQATFEQIVSTLVRGRFARNCRLSTWASSVAAHVAFNALRARRRARRVFDGVELSDVPERAANGDAERDASARQEIRAVQAHLAGMNPKKAMVVVLHDVLGHDLAEISTMLGISVSAAQSRLVRGRGDLLRRLGASGKGGDEGVSDGA